MRRKYRGIVPGLANPREGQLNAADAWQDAYPLRPQLAGEAGADAEQQRIARSEHHDSLARAGSEPDLRDAALDIRAQDDALAGRVRTLRQLALASCQQVGVA